jgi:DNA-binding CsgD family transcriptional regulator
MSEGRSRDTGEPVHTVATLLRAHPATESLTALARFMESSPNCIIITSASADFTCNYLNRAARRRFRIKVHQVAGRPLREILPGGGRDDFLCALRAAVGRMTAIHRRFPDETHSRGPAQDSGELLIKDWNVYPMSDRRGMVKHLMLGERVRLTQGTRSCPEPRPRRSIWNARTRSSVPNDVDSHDEMSQALLTTREWQVAELVALGLTNRSIAQRLFLSRPTVATHVARILGKLSLVSRVQLAAWVTRQRAFSQS